jgi:hypothetical protein
VAGIARAGLVKIDDFGFIWKSPEQSDSWRKILRNISLIMVTKPQLASPTILCGVDELVGRTIIRQKFTYSFSIHA